MNKVSQYLPGIYSIVENIFTSLEQTLSAESYGNIVSILKPILTVSLILLAIYIVYSILHFFYSIITLRRIKITVIFSVIVAIVFLILFYIIYDYLFGLIF